MTIPGIIGKHDSNNSIDIFSSGFQIHKKRYIKEIVPLSITSPLCVIFFMYMSVLFISFICYLCTIKCLSTLFLCIVVSFSFLAIVMFIVEYLLLSLRVSLI